MKIRFWGTRGSIPVSMTASDVRARLITALERAKDRQFEHYGDIEAYVDELDFDIAGTFGGHSSCVQIDAGGKERILLDLGSGARPFGQHMVEQLGEDNTQDYHAFLSHPHLDHIMGFPFFAPAYIPGNRIIIHSCHEDVEVAFQNQQKPPLFPINFEQLRADILFNIIEPDTRYQIAGMDISAKKQHHTGDSYGWRFEKDGKILVYATDFEHRIEDVLEREHLVEFFADADAVIFDAMYSLADTVSIKADWGHSSNIIGVELCQLAHAKRLILFHHEPTHDDNKIWHILKETQRFEEITHDDHRVEILSAWDGMEIVL